MKYEIQFYTQSIQYKYFISSILFVFFSFFFFGIVFGVSVRFWRILFCFWMVKRIKSLHCFLLQIIFADIFVFVGDESICVVSYFVFGCGCIFFVFCLCCIVVGWWKGSLPKKILIFWF